MNIITINSYKGESLFADKLNQIISNAKAVLSLHKRGYKIIYPDVNRIYNIMLSELSK